MSKKASAAKRANAQARGAQLRVAHIWRDEVMADHVLTIPGEVTLGTTKGSTFTIPDVGLPDGFAILQPGSRGYTLALSSDMAGQLGLSGDQVEVPDLIESQGDSADLSNEVHTTAIKPGDWGVVEFDRSGQHKIFFQFVADEPPLPPSGWRDTELLWPAIAFALIFHTVLLAISFTLKEDGNSMVFPGRRELMARYLVRRPPAPVKTQEQSASKDGDKEAVKSATKGDKGKSGGEKEQPIARDPLAKKIAPDTPKVALLDTKARRTVTRIITHKAMDDKVARMLNRMGPRQTGSNTAGSGIGIGLGAGKNGTGTTRGTNRTGSGGGGSADKLFVSQGKIDAGETRAPKGKNGKGRARKEVAVIGTGKASGDFGGWTEAEIQKVIRSRKGFIRACYQNELNRVRGLGGKVVVQFRIKGSGQVGSARVVPGKSSLRNPRVESCIKRQITRLKFPPKGGSAVVDYPFIFSHG